MTKHNRFPPEVLFTWFWKTRTPTTHNGPQSAPLPLSPPADDEPNALTTNERQRLKELEREVRALRRSIADWPINRVSELLPWRIELPTE